MYIFSCSYKEKGFSPQDNLSPETSSWRKEAEERENKYLPHHGSFMYLFQWVGKPTGNFFYL